MSKLIEIADKNKHFFFNVNNIMYVRKTDNGFFDFGIEVKLNNGEVISFDYGTYWDEESSYEEPSSLWKIYEELPDDEEHYEEKCRLHKEYLKCMELRCRHLRDKEFTSIFSQWTSN